MWQPQCKNTSHVSVLRHVESTCGPGLLPFSDSSQGWILHDSMHASCFSKHPGSNSQSWARSCGESGLDSSGKADSPAWAHIKGPSNIHLPQARPDVILVTKHLLLFLSELKRKSEGLLPALDDMRRKLQQGLPAMHYGNLPYLLAAAQAGTAVQMCAVSADGKVCQMLFACITSFAVLSRPDPSWKDTCMHPSSLLIRCIGKLAPSTD